MTQCKYSPLICLFTHLRSFQGGVHGGGGGGHAWQGGACMVGGGMLWQGSMRGTHLLPVDRILDTRKDENITFPQLPLRAVITLLRVSTFWRELEFNLKLIKTWCKIPAFLKHVYLSFFVFPAAYFCGSGCQTNLYTALFQDITKITNSFAFG